MNISGWLLSSGDFKIIEKYRNLFIKNDIDFAIKNDDGIIIINFYKYDNINIEKFISSINNLTINEHDEIGEFFMFDINDFKHYIIKNSYVKLMHDFDKPDISDIQ